MTNEDDFSDSIVARSDQLNAIDLLSNELTIIITEIKKSKDPKQPMVIHYVNDNGKPYKPCLLMRRIITTGWGMKLSGDVCRGRSILLYRDENVRYGADITGGIRISAMSNIPREIKLTQQTSRGKWKEFSVSVLPSSTSTASPKPDPAFDMLYRNAERAAEKGMAELEAWFKALPKESQAKIKPSLESLKEKANVAPTLS